MDKDAIIIGAGPCGLSAAIYLQEIGLHPILIEKGNIVNAIYQYPTHQTFFSTPEKLEIGGIPFVIEERKPRRNQALSYYRRVVDEKKLTIHAYETVQHVNKDSSDSFVVHTTTKDGQSHQYRSAYVIIATGYYDSPNIMGVPGEEQAHVLHYFKEAHPFFNQRVAIIGGKNSAVDATLELEKAGAHVTVLYRGDIFSKSVKPWILPEFQSLLTHRKVDMIWKAEVLQIGTRSITYRNETGTKTLPVDFVLAMTGYHPDHSFLTKIGVDIEVATGRPVHTPETMETNVTNLFIAGVIAAGNEANEIFIENGRFHGQRIAEEIARRGGN